MDKHLQSKAFTPENKEDIFLDSKSKIEKRIDYINLLIDNDHKRLVLIDSSRNSNLNYSLITYAAAFGASLKFLQDINPIIISSSLLFLSLAFFLRDYRLHQYSHGWTITITNHLKILSHLLNEPDHIQTTRIYYKKGEKRANNFKELYSPTRLAYYILIIGSILTFFIFKFN
jgi:hypothetical protein